MKVYTLANTSCLASVSVLACCKICANLVKGIVLRYITVSMVYYSKAALKTIFFLTALSMLYVSCKMPKESDGKNPCVESFNPGTKTEAEFINYRNNPMFSRQYYLNQTSDVDINVVPAWCAGYGRKPISVAVLDQAIDKTHPDLQGNVFVRCFGSYNAEHRHGTSVAGILGAKDNEIGIIGVAPHAKIYGYGFASSGIKNEDELRSLVSKAFTDNHGEIAVYNASFGTNTFYGTYYNRLSSEEKQVFNRLSEEGFKGKGSSIVFAAGNSRSASTHDGYLNHHTVIGVNSIPGTTSKNVTAKDPAAPCGQVESPGTTSKNVTAKEFSRGENLWVTAPAAGVTTDNGGKYTEDFGGTSSAAPLVSGAVALLRSEYPHLTWRDVKLLLAESAKKYDIGGEAAYEKSGLKYFDGTEQQYSSRMGFGLLDVHELLTMAKNWRLLPPMKSTSYASEKNYLIQEGKKQKVSFPLTIGSSGIKFIETVTLEFTPESDAKFHNIFFLKVSITSPNGIKGTFILYFMGNGSPITLLSNRYLGNSSADGAWNVEIEKTHAEEEMSLKDIRITIRGH